MMQRRMPRPLAAYFLVVTIILAGACKKRMAMESDVDFGSGEHKWLGDVAFEQVCKEAGEACPANKQLMRKDGKESYTYGSLVAFSGDFFEKPNDIYDKAEKLLGRFHNKKYVMSQFEKQVNAINKIYHGEDGEYPHNSVGVALSIPQYGLLALNNDDHFGWHNMVAYVEHHQAALDLAKEAHALKSRDSANAQAMFVHALFFNAFADHFLTDAFAAGHIRVPRTQLKAWATTKNYTSALGGALAKVIHDFDGKLGEHYPKGLNVRNAAGDVWATRVDAELFIRLEGDAKTVELPTQAVVLSLKDVFDTYETGAQPEGIFAAARLVPYVDTSLEMGLAERFRSLPADGAQGLVASKDWFSKVPFFTKVTPDHVATLTAALPALMDEFAKGVRSEAGANEQVKRRLPSEYIAYFSGIK